MPSPTSIGLRPAMPMSSPGPTAPSRSQTAPWDWRSPARTCHGMARRTPRLRRPPFTVADRKPGPSPHNPLRSTGAQVSRAGSFACAGVPLVPRGTGGARAHTRRQAPARLNQRLGLSQIADRLGRWLGRRRGADQPQGMWTGECGPRLVHCEILTPTIRTG